MNFASYFLQNFNNDKKSKKDSIQKDLKVFRHDFKLTNLNNKKQSGAANASNFNLPFMGHITLNLGQKPRRGRKPKKSDISNMIYKNYGIVLPSQLLNESQNCCEIKSEDRQEVKEEPLNLCVREVSPKQKSRPIRSPTNEQGSQNGVRMSKFKFVNGFLQEKTVYSVDKKGNTTSTTDSKVRKNLKIEKSKKINKVEKKIPKLMPNFEESNSKDKGILIKTQEQLTANARFTKFRHLKKFTRYLLKNWKIPMDVTQQKQQQEVK
jgi:hypothetical protein